MPLSFGFTFKKMKASDVGRIKGHNLRTHPTVSQLQRPDAWFTDRGHHTVVSWDDAKIEKAKSLAKRKDAVQALCFSIQVGSQIDWRATPSKEFPEGRPLAQKDDLRLLQKGSRAIAEEIFGKENVVSIELHTDESTPHVQFVVTPIFEGKLQAKHWLNGVSACATLRKKACEIMNRYIECTYEPGNPGGEPHQPGLSAGAKLAPEKASVLDRVFKGKEKELEAELTAANERVRALEQALFSKQKARYSKEMIDAANAAAEAAVIEKDAAVREKNAAVAALTTARRDLDNAKNELLEFIGVAKSKMQEEKGKYHHLINENQQLKIDLVEERNLRVIVEQRVTRLDQELRRLKGNDRNFSNNL